MNHKPTFIRLTKALQQPFITFLEQLFDQGDKDFFHPHGFDKASAAEVVTESEESADEYWVCLIDNEIAAYGMLRGWAEGFDIPSLGIATAPKHRGRGHGKQMMTHLHNIARSRGATKVRLKVDKMNFVAKSLYEKLGYKFEVYSQTEFIGFLQLDDLVS